METSVGGSFSPAAGQVNGTGTTYQLAASAATEATSAAYSNSLRFAASKSIRTSTIILATFNTIIATATALGIIYDCYALKKRRDRKKPTQPPSGLFFITPCQVFPLVLSLGIAIQGITFATAQSVGLQGLLSSGCTLTAIFMLPGLFITPYIQLVFGVETAMRALRSEPFAPRGIWNVRICLGAVCTFLLVNFLVADFIRTPDFCFASLMWFVKLYAPGCFALLLGISVISIVVIIIVFVKLGRSSNVSPIERMTATRTIYYVALGVVSNAFVIPFFFSVVFLDQKANLLNNLNLSMIASVVINVTGLLVAGLHLFLRSQIKPDNGHRDTFNDDEIKKLKEQLRARSNSDANRDANSDDSPLSPIYFKPPVPNPLRANAIFPIVTIPQTPEPAVAPSETSPSHLRKQSYSLFPHDTPAATQAVSLLPSTTYSPVATKPSRDTFRPPPSVKTFMGRGHRRDSSVVSSATVQIGLRLSNVEDIGPPRNKVFKGKEKEEGPARSSPLAEVDVAEDESDARSNHTTSSKYSTDDSSLDSDDDPKRKSLKDAIMKMLPPIPKIGNNKKEKVDSEHELLITLSPLVYSPQDQAKTKLPSPMGVGFSMPNRAGSDKSPVLAPLRRNNSSASNNKTMTVPPLRRNASDAAASSTLPIEGKSDWI